MLLLTLQCEYIFVSESWSADVSLILSNVQNRPESHFQSFEKLAIRF